MFNERITIRPATLEDAPDIVKVHIQAWQESYKDIIAEDYLNNLAFSDQRLKKRIDILQNNPGLHLVSLVYDKIVGFIDAGPSRDIEEERGQIYAIYLLDKYKRFHIGSMLWEKAREYLVINQLLPFKVWVLKNNLPAIRFYEKQGGILKEEQEVIIDGQKYKEVSYSFNKL